MLLYNCISWPWRGIIAQRPVKISVKTGRVDTEITKIYAFGKYLIETRHLFPTLTEEETLMGDNTLRPFAYAHSPAIMNALITEAKNRQHFVSGGYDFLERPGEHMAFDKMIALAKDIDRSLRVLSRLNSWMA